MDRRLLDYNPESETFEAGAIAQGESEWRGATDTEAVFGEADEMELAAELLEATSEAELEQFLGDLIDRAGQAIGRAAPGPVRGALATMLKDAAKRTLPIIGRALGQQVGGAAGAESARRSSMPPRSISASSSKASVPKTRSSKPPGDSSALRARRRRTPSRRPPQCRPKPRWLGPHAATRQGC